MTNLLLPTSRSGQGGAKTLPSLLAGRRVPWEREPEFAEVSGSGGRRRAHLAGRTTFIPPGPRVLSCVGRHVETGQSGRPFGVRCRVAGSIAGLEGEPFCSAPTQKVKGWRPRRGRCGRLVGTRFSTRTSALASTAPLRMLEGALWVPASVLLCFSLGWETRECLSLQTL